MRVHETLSRHAAEVTEVVDITDVDLPADQFEGLTRTLRSGDEIDDVEVGPGAALLALMGPNVSAHTGPEQLVPLLEAVQPGAYALLLLGWVPDELPAQRLLGALDAREAHIVAAIPLATPSDGAAAPVIGVQCALLISRTAPSRREVNERALAGLSERAGTGRPDRARPAAAQAAQTPTGKPAGAGPVPMPALARAALRLPRRMARKVLGPKNPGSRVVPIALPTTGRAPGRPELLTMTAPSNLLVPRRIAESGLAGYETSAVACFAAACDVAGPGAVLDIGANVGIYAAVGRALTQRQVIAFEPWEMLVDVARRFSADNDLDFTTEALALGAANRTQTLYLSDVGDSSNSLRRNFRPSSNQIQVPVETLDSYVARTGTVPAVMKVDTEATEPDVLIGAEKTIAEYRPWILCEVLSGRVERRLHELLASLGYRWYHIQDEIPLREAARIVGDPAYENLMWLFAPEKPWEEFWSALRDRAASLSTCTEQRARALLATQSRAGRAQRLWAANGRAGKATNRRTGQTGQGRTGPAAPSRSREG
ncbi:MAG: FkbM family methyltransferase [Betaproteobacteria bacterium]